MCVYLLVEYYDNLKLVLEFYLSNILKIEKSLKIKDIEVIW